MMEWLKKKKKNDEWKKNEKKEKNEALGWKPKNGSLEQKKVSKHTFEGVKNWNAASKVF